MVKKEKVVLAYSGGLDTSIIIPWLKDNYGDLDIIACCVNVGQEDDMGQVREKAISSGASKVYVENVVNEFVEDYVYKGLKANASYECKYLLGTAYARPLIAKKLVEVAHKEGAKYIAHGCTGKGNDQVRLETAIASIDPTIEIIAPWRIWNITSREEAIDYAMSKNINLNGISKEKIYSRDQNILHISHEGGMLENPANEADFDEILVMSNTVEKAPDIGEYIEIEFKEGIPVKLNGKKLNGEKMLAALNKIGGIHGIGVIDLLENRLVGMKSRGIYETPGGTILIEAHKYLESFVLEKETAHFKDIIGQKYAELVYNAMWFSGLKDAFDAFVDSTQKNVTGTVKLKLYKGNVKFAGMVSQNALYNEEISSFSTGDLYDQKDASGFINLYSLPYKIQALNKLNNTGEKAIEINYSFKE
ncbi:argininosuccinate synthase [Sedimentibacter acidaminivorans]|uniref:Argininosuccinate synthase n=1 Tax=Sedimentibacter acidaminivorans TaxID=913099 RepID=A0ABS4GGJ6_9FIRM|nr:argininosuccinate synthase [Sedimentibacter acidaminivorans]MBP1926818.1 argininosuccinate synthase [Sedimentibacter acidaminivorans]